MKFLEKKKKLQSITMLLLCFLMIFSMAGSTVYASSDMPGYENPKTIIIASPKNNYSTSSSKISILGASDYEYPLYMNGQLIETTEYGFFTEYVELAVGKNEFIFENNGVIQTITITRKKPATSSGGSSTGTAKDTYKAYKKDTYGVITSSYAMPRGKVNDADLSKMPLTKGTTFRILGEDKGFYKLSDNTYVSKSSIKSYEKKLADNKVTAVSVQENINTNHMVAKMSMNVNALHSVEIKGQKVYLTLKDTVYGAGAKLAKNSLIEKVSVTTDSDAKTVTYCFTLYENALLCGYDIRFDEDGLMRFEMKQAPKLVEAGSLKGATILLDAGHGDTDNGTVGAMGTFGPVEKDVNLAITQYTKKYLENLGAKVVMIRSDDTFYSLSARVAEIRDLRPDISVSIHGNSLDVISDYSKSSGFLTYYSYNLFNNAPAKINKSIVEKMGMSEREIRAKSLSLTRLTTCPAMLLETSFLSHPEDYEFLIKEENQKKFGNAIGKAIQEYLESVAVYENGDENPNQDINYIIHTVKKGETLSSIARKYNVKMSAIINLNNIADINHIVVGHKYKIPQ